MELLNLTAIRRNGSPITASFEVDISDEGAPRNLDSDAVMKALGVGSGPVEETGIIRIFAHVDFGLSGIRCHMTYEFENTQVLRLFLENSDEWSHGACWSWDYYKTEAYARCRSREEAETET